MTPDEAAARARIRSFLAPITIIVLSIPMVLNLLPRNWLYGIRTRETMASDAAWEAANRLGGLVIIGACVIWLVAAAWLPVRFARAVGIAAILGAVALLFMTQGWSI